MLVGSGGWPSMLVIVTVVSVVVGGGCQWFVVDTDHCYSFPMVVVSDGLQWLVVDAGHCYSFDSGGGG